jgi:hypothetical protein
MAPGGPARGLTSTENVAVTYLGGGRYRINVTPRSIDLAARFTLDEAAALDYVGRVIAAHGSGEIPADDSPRFGATWDPRGPDEEATVSRLVRYAADHGVIVRPEGMDLDFVYNPDASDGGSYHFAVDIGHDVVGQVTLQSWDTEMRKLVDDEAGADAAMSILAEAVARANRVLDKLAALITKHGGTGPAATCCPYHSYTGAEARRFVHGLVDEEMNRTDDAFAGEATTDDYLVDVIRHLNCMLADRNKVFADE